MYKKILTPIDLSEPAMTQKAIAASLELAKLGHAQIRLVNVQALTPLAFMDYVPADFDQRLRDSIDQELAKVAMGVDYPRELVSSTLRFGVVYPEVLAEAESWGADLIVIGSHRPSMSTYLLGSNAKTIVRHAKCSVLVARD